MKALRRHLAILSRPNPAAGLVALAVLALAGCTLTPPVCDRSGLSEQVTERTGYALGPPPPTDRLVLPNGASVEDGLTEEEAVVIALWNNALFHEQLADLGVAHGDLVQAGLLPNPEAVYFVPVSNKPYKYLFDLPLEAFWLLPIRVKAAANEVDRVSHRLTQAALDLIRDVRQAYADILIARGRLKVADEAVRIRSEIAKIAEARLDAGDISPQEAATARIDAGVAQQDQTRIRYDVSLAEERLRNLLAIGTLRCALTLDDAEPPTCGCPDVEALTAEAVATRPDALAAERNAAAAAERLRIAKIGWVRLLGLADATSGRKTGHEFGPAFRVTLPLFNWNQGAIERAAAELERAVRQRVTVRNQIILDVHQAHYRFRQACAEMEILQGKVLPQVEEAIGRAERAYREGNTPYVVILETTRQLLDGQFRRAQLRGELRRAWADLERSVGRHLDLPPASPAPEAPKK